MLFDNYFLQTLIMGTFNNLLGKLFGTKAERDLKEVTPFIEKINIEHEKIKDSNNDQLRKLSAELKEKIRKSFQSEQDEIDVLKLKIEIPQLILNKKRGVV